MMIVPAGVKVHLALDEFFCFCNGCPKLCGAAKSPNLSLMAKNRATVSSIIAPVCACQTAANELCRLASLRIVKIECGRSRGGIKSGI
jgi:hypothetical protein